MFKKAVQFLNEVKNEAGKIVWPDFVDMKRSVALVGAAVLIFSLACLVCDYLIHTIVKFLLSIGL